MHPLVNYAIKVLRKHSKKWITFFDNECCDPIYSPDELKKLYQNHASAIFEKIRSDMLYGDQESDVFFDCSFFKNSFSLKDASKYWYFSELDGIENFLSGVGIFKLSMSYIENDSVKATIFFDLIGDDIVCALEGYGAQKNEKRLRCEPKTHSSLFCTNSEKAVSLFAPHHLHPRILGSIDSEIGLILEGKVAFGLYKNLELFAAQRLLLKESLCSCFEITLEDKKHFLIGHKTIIGKIAEVLR